VEGRQVNWGEGCHGRIGGSPMVDFCFTPGLLFKYYFEIEIKAVHSTQGLAHECIY
jgi:hypothetical protein